MRNPATEGLLSERGVVYQWLSDSGYEYTWSMPEGFALGRSYDLLLVLAGDGEDAEGGHRSAMRLGLDRCAACGDQGDGEGRIVVGVKPGFGTSEDPADFRMEVLPVRDLVLELGRVFPADRIIMFASGTSGGFALRVLERYPALAEGVVIRGVRGSGLLAHDSRELVRLKDIRGVPVAFVVGDQDPVDLYAETVASFRVMIGDNPRDTSNLARLVRFFGEGEAGASAEALALRECVDWCAAMRTGEADEALSVLSAMLGREGLRVDEHGAVLGGVPVWFGGAEGVLRRFVDGALYSINAGAEQRAWAGDVRRAVERHGEAHAERIRDAVRRESDFVPDGGAWIGELMLARESFRGVLSVESVVFDVGYDGADARVAEAFEEWYELWRTGNVAGRVGGLVWGGLPRVMETGVLDTRIGTSARRGFVRWYLHPETTALEGEVRERAEVVVNIQRGWSAGVGGYADVEDGWDGLWERVSGTGEAGAIRSGNRPGSD